MPTSATGLTRTITLMTLAGTALLGACAGMEPSRPLSEQKPDADRAPAEGVTVDEETQRRIDQMRQAMAARNSEGDAEGTNNNWDAPRTDAVWTPDESNRPRTTGEPVTLESASAERSPGDEASMEPRALTLDERVSKHASELAAVLRERSERDPSRAAESLAALGALAITEPGVASAYLPDAGAMSRRLTPTEATLVRTWHEMSRDLPLVLAGGDAGRGVAELMRRGAESLDSPALAIPTAVLCDRVEGYGIYRELPRSGGKHKLLAGRKNQAIVYVELDGYAFRGSTRDGAAGNLIELTQDFALYESGGGVLAWRMTEQDITDFSRNRRRDFYVLQVIELPATLSVGAYELKISMRDRNGGSVAERVIPVDVVADASAMRDK